MRYETSRAFAAALLLGLWSTVAMAETNLAWVPSSASNRNSGSWQVASSTSLVLSGSSWSGASIVQFGGLADSAPVYACTVDVPIGQTDGCPTPGNYTQERFILKSQVNQGAAPPPDPPPPDPPPDPPPPPTVTGNATLTWDAPTGRTDGSPLTNLAGFRAYYGQSQGNLSSQVTIADPAARSYQITGLAAGLWHFAISAYDAAGLESARSNTVSKQVTGTDPPPPAPVDCVVSEWGPWIPGEWSACVNGERSREETRQRSVLVDPANGGSACPHLDENRVVTEACAAPPPAPVVVENRPGVPVAAVFGITAAGGRSSTVLGYAPVGAACEGPVVYRYRSQDYRRLAAGVVLWWPTTTTPTANAAAACQ